MQFKLTLITKEAGAVLPFNYQYPLSSALYKIIQRADKEFSSFVQNAGYGSGYKSFKLFTFSDIKSPFKNEGDRMLLQSAEAELITSFYVPAIAEPFIKDLFKNQYLVIADKKSKATFSIANVNTLAESLMFADSAQYHLLPLSPMVVGKKNNRGHYDYRSPEDVDFAECLIHNWLEKYRLVKKIDEEALMPIKEKMNIQVKYFTNPPQKRLITIKEGTEAQTRIRAYTRFKLDVSAPKELIEFALGAGLGLHNAQGFGCMGMAKPYK